MVGVGWVLKRLNEDKQRLRGSPGKPSNRPRSFDAINQWAAITEGMDRRLQYLNLISSTTSPRARVNLSLRQAKRSRKRNRWILSLSSNARGIRTRWPNHSQSCLLYTSDAATKRIV